MATTSEKPDELTGPVLEVLPKLLAEAAAKLCWQQSRRWSCAMNSSSA